MLCDDCQQKAASVHITTINNGKKNEKHLCEDCARQAGELSLSASAQFSVHDLLKGLFPQGAAGIAPAGSSACPGCGMSFADFNRCGKIGCSDCYSTYGERLAPVIRRIHGFSCHTGKVPKKSGGSLAVKQRLRRLKSELEQHVAREEYEKAAQLRDEIRLLEKELEGGKG